MQFINNNTETEEIYKDIEGFPGYQVSNMGNVKSLNYNRTGGEKILKRGINKSGYPQVGFSIDNKKYFKLVHLLVWDAFSDVPRDGIKLQVDHLNNNKLDNRFENLQLLIPRENVIKHQLTRKKSSKYTGVSWHKQNNKWRSQIELNKKIKHLGYFTNELDAAEAYQNALKNI